MNSGVKGPERGCGCKAGGCWAVCGLGPQGAGCAFYRVSVRRPSGACVRSCSYRHPAPLPVCHCRTEMMDRKTAEACVRLMRSSSSITTVDITGGAPELNAQFR